MAKHWMAGAVKHPGALHRALGVPTGENIPASKVAAAASSSNPRLARMGRLAETFANHAPTDAHAHHPHQHPIADHPVGPVPRHEAAYADHPES